MERVIALLTDFGYSDYYPGVLEGIIRKINPEADIINITHGIPAFDLLSASFVIDKNFRFFPRSTIFLVVVDPGVGSDRKILLVSHDDYWFIAPDNGVLTPILNQSRTEVRSLEDKRFFLMAKKNLDERVSTFEARDKMAPVAAYLSKGVDPQELSLPATKFVYQEEYYPLPGRNGIAGRIVYCDHFGNLVSNISGETLDKHLKESGLSQFAVRIKGIDIKESYKTYKNGATSPFILIGSHGNIEIAINKRSAAKLLNVSPGQPLRIKFY
jgi:S-adenosylmethionine hydrolase